MREILENSFKLSLSKMSKELDREINKLIKQSKKLQNEEIIVFDDSCDSNNIM